MASLADYLRQFQRRMRSRIGFDVEARLISDQLAYEREIIRRSWHVSGLEGRARANAQRAVHSIVRKRYKGGKREVEISREQRALLIRNIRPSLIFDRLYPERLRPGGWLPIPQRDPDDATVIDLENFSFLVDPISTIEGLRKIAAAEALGVDVRINFKDKYCLDLCPFMLLMEGWRQMIPIFEGGEMDIPMQKVLVALGIPQAMGISVGGVSDLDDVWAFPLRRRRGAGSSESRLPYMDVQTREIANDDFCYAVDDWLAEVGMELTDSGTGWIKNILGELLENAERHGDGGRRDGAWSVSGCMVRRKDDTENWVLQVYIGIVNLGDTFSTTLDRAGIETRKKLDAYVDHMRMKGAVQTTETLRTLAALQDGVTCVAEADANDRGGYGLQEMLDLVNTLGQTQDGEKKPKITIVSGSSCVQLRDPYIHGNRVDGPDGARVLWCNASNSRSEPPDPRFVFDLPRELPGTAISIGFTLDQYHYERIRKEGGDHDNDRFDSADR